MRRPAAMAALAVATFLASSACSTRGQETSRAADAGSASSAAQTQPKLELVETTDGLRPDHLRVPPLVEKVAYIPAVVRGEKGDTVVSRIYPDGSYYMLLTQLKNTPVSPRWSLLLSLRPEGIERLNALFARICGTPDSLALDDMSRVKYHVTSAGCTRTFVNGLPSNQSPIREADTIINTTTNPIPRSP